MVEERDSTTTAVKLLITSFHGDATAELPFSECVVVRWNAVVDALTEANYCFAMRRLTPLSPCLAVAGFKRKLAVLSLLASKKAAFFYCDGSTEGYFEISRDEKLMDGLPSHVSFKGLPRFRRFASLPEDLQLSVVRRLDGAGFATMRCVCRRFSQLRWDRDFDISRYSRPRSRSGAAEAADEWDWDDDRVPVAGFAAAVVMAAVTSAIMNLSDSRPYDGGSERWRFRQTKVSSVDVFCKKSECNYVSNRDQFRKCWWIDF